MIKHIKRTAHQSCKMYVFSALKKFVKHLKDLKNAKLYTRISEKEKIGDKIWMIFKINSILGRKLGEKMSFQGIGTVWTKSESSLEVTKTFVELRNYRNINFGLQPLRLPHSIFYSRQK